MKSCQASEDLTLLNNQMTEVFEENQPPQPHQRKRELQKLLLSLKCKLNKLAFVNSQLFQMISPSEKKKLNSDDPGFSRLSQMPPRQNVFTEPVLSFRLSWLLDFLRQSYGFEHCGIFLLDDGNGGSPRLALYSESSEEFEDEVKALWSGGNIFRAIDQKRRMIFPAKKEGNLLVIPFKILGKKDGFWVAHFKQGIPTKKKKYADMLFWVELLGSCIENSSLKGSSLHPNRDKSYHIETEKLFTTTELSKAVVHEINNSLQIILGRAQLLKMNEKKSQKAPSNISNLEMIEGNANRTCLILKDFSDHLHRQFDQTTDAKEVNIQHILKSVMVPIKCILESKEIRLELNLGNDLPLVYGSPGELELAFLSLIWEIGDRLSSGGSIRLQTFTEEESLCLDMYWSAKEIKTGEYPDFTDVETDDRLRMVSQILNRNHGDIKFKKISDTEMGFSLRFGILPEVKKNQEALHQLKL